MPLVIFNQSINQGLFSTQANNNIHSTHVYKCMHIIIIVCLNVEQTLIDIDSASQVAFFRASESVSTLAYQCTYFNLYSSPCSHRNFILIMTMTSLTNMLSDF